MELSVKSISDEKQEWEKAGISLPDYDYEQVRKNTLERPVWLHFGPGNIFRGFIGSIADKLIASGDMDTGIVAMSNFDGEIIDKIYKPFDMLTLSVGLRSDGNSEKRVLAGIGNAIKADEDSKEQLKKIATSESLQLISFTITEKGYAVKDMSGEFLPGTEKDIKNGPGLAETAMGIVAELLYYRFSENKCPVAVVSMDNCSQNGSKLKNAVLTMAKGWLENGFVSEEFISYVNDESKVTFPWSMIDKITPRPADEVAEELEKLGVINMNPIVTKKNTYIAPFVNAEIPEYLVIEDSFPNGRPPLEKAGVYMTDRDTVNKAETMKVTTCLNPLHTALAVCGCLLGFTKISDEMMDEDLKNLVYALGQEGLKVVVNPGIIKPEEFLNEVLTERLPNPFMPDTPQRIATDTSQKLVIRYGETIKSYMKEGKLSDLKIIPFVIAAWFRYLIGVDDEGREMELSPDPLMDVLAPLVKDIKLGQKVDDNSGINYILSKEELFGVNLLEAESMSQKIIGYLNEMLEGPGAVRTTLKKVI
ncbi:MAG: mannitol dehydrogenase family protein [Eubacterium sp.]|nr:mannitol dehydrogenase family protein [Eubacterium sp.]